MAQAHVSSTYERHDTFSQPPRRVGLIGHPVAHSHSPAMQQAAFDAVGVAARYELWDTPPEAVAERVARLREPGYLGANVTIPYKAAVIPYLDSITPQARMLAGVVNTITREETAAGIRLIGHNTDVLALVQVLDEQQVGHRLADADVAANLASGGAQTALGDQIGALYALSEHTGVARRSGRLLVLGAGGAAQAALGAALLRGMEPWVAARRQSAAHDALAALYARQQAATPPPDSHVWLARALDLGDADALRRALRETGALVNATPVGTRDPDPEATPLPLELLRLLPEEAFVLDMVYNPPETALVRAARALGLRASGGFDMLLYQGAAAFTLWTGAPAPVGVMRDALRVSLAHANPT